MIKLARRSFSLLAICLFAFFSLMAGSITLVNVFNGSKSGVSAAAPSNAIGANFGSATYDQFRIVEPTSDGGYVAVGSTGGASTNLGAHNWTHSGSLEGDGIIVKFNASGQVSWATSYSMGDDDYTQSVVELSDGSFICIGASAFDITHAPYEDCTAFKFNANGGLVWAKDLTWSNYYTIQDTIATSDGGFIGVGGSTSTHVTHPWGSNLGYADAIMIKFDANANIIWGKTYGGSSYERFVSITIDNNNNYICAGYARGASSNMASNWGHAGATDAILVKTDSSGNAIWAKNFGGSDDDYFNDVVITTDGNIVCAGRSTATSPHWGNVGTTDAIVIKLNSSGTVLWSKNFGGTNGESASGLVATPDGGVIVVGYSMGASTNLTNNWARLPGNTAYTYDAIAFRLNTSGNDVWAQSYGGSASESFYDAAVLDNGKVVFVGDAYAISTNLPTNWGNCGGSDAITVTLDFSKTISYVVDGVAYTNSNLPSAYVVGTAQTLWVPSKTGYSFSGWCSNTACTVSKPGIVAGDSVNLVFYGKFTPNPYTLTINYAFASGAQNVPSGSLPAKHTSSVLYGNTFSVNSAVIPGYTASISTVSGTMDSTSGRTFNVTYTPNEYALTINYVFKSGSQNTPAAPTAHVQNYAFGAGYSVTSQALTGYTVSSGTVSGTMDTVGGKTVTVTYTPIAYTLTITYKYSGGSLSGQDAHTTYSSSVDYGAGYEVNSPALTGYSVSIAKVTGTMNSTAGRTHAVTYSPINYTLTITYKYSGGALSGQTADSTYTLAVPYQTTYSRVSPSITGYTASIGTVTGTMNSTSGVTVAVTYAPISYTLTITYKYLGGASDGQTASTTHTAQVAYSTTYSRTSPTITGYTPSIGTVTGTMDSTSGKTVAVTYAPNNYTLTVNYAFAAGALNTPATPTQHTSSVAYSTAYSVVSPSVPGYTPNVSTVSGTMSNTSGVTVTVTYTPIKYKVTVTYAFSTGAQNTPAVPTAKSQDIDYGSPYSFASDTLTGYTADATLVSGNLIQTSALNITITYTPNNYSVAVYYQFAAGSQNVPASELPTTATTSVPYNHTYSYSVKLIDGYTPNVSTVSGTMNSTSGKIHLVTYTPNEYQLKITFVFAAGALNTPTSSLPVTHTQGVAYGAPYNIDSAVIKTIAGYTASQTTVSGNMALNGVTVAITYAPENYTLTINYTFHASAQNPPSAPAQYTESVVFGGNYSIASDVIPGYTASQSTVNGIMDSTAGKVEAVVYTPSLFALVVTYVFASGTPGSPSAPLQYNENVLFGSTYSHTSPVLAGYTADVLAVSGTMNTTSGRSVIVTYTAEQYALTINYDFEAGAPNTPAAPTTYSVNYKYLATYSVTSPTLTGYTPSIAIVAGDMDTVGGKVVTVTYTPKTYQLGIMYKYAEGTPGNPPTLSYMVYQVVFNDDYSITTPTLTGYTPNITVVSGRMDSEHKTATVTYTANTYNIYYYVGGVLYNDGANLPTTYMYGAGVASFYSPESVGQTFSGWHSDAGLENAMTYISVTQTGDVTLYGEFATDSYKLEVLYVFSAGTLYAPQAPTTSVTYKLYGTNYSVPSPSLPGYSPDIAVVSGTMPAGAVSVTVTYSAVQYTLTVNYLYTNETVASAPYTELVSFNYLYSVTSPLVTGHTASETVVSGSMITVGGITETVYYTANEYGLVYYLNGSVYTDAALADTYIYGIALSLDGLEKLGYDFDGWYEDVLMQSAKNSIETTDIGTITLYATLLAKTYSLEIIYVFADNTPGSPMAPTKHEDTVAYDDAYSVSSPLLTGYTADVLTVSGTMDSVLGITVTVTYSANTYTLTVNYKHTDNSMAATTHTESVLYGASYTVVSPTVTGHTADLLTVIGDMDAEGKSIDVVYTVNTYTLTIRVGTKEYTEIVTYNTTFSLDTLTSLNLKKDGYKFVGWKNEATGESVSLTDNELLYLFTTDTTLLAVWEEIPQDTTWIIVLAIVLTLLLIAGVIIGILMSKKRKKIIKRI